VFIQKGLADTDSVGAGLPAMAYGLALQKRLMHLVQRFKVIGRCFSAQLIPTAKPVPYRRRVQAIATRTDQVVLAIADHQRIGRVQAFLGHQVSDQLDFIGPGSIEFAAVNHFEVLGKVEMPGDFAGEHPRLGGGDVKLSPLSTQGFE